MLQPRGQFSAPMMIVTECVSYRDLGLNTILSEREMDRMLEDAGVPLWNCFYSAVIREQIPGQDFASQMPKAKKDITPVHRYLHNKAVGPAITRGLDTLWKEIDQIKPKVVLALGSAALFALTGKIGIKSWRGSILEAESPGGHKFHIIPSYTPGYVNALWEERNITIHDYRKAWSISLNGPPVKPAYNFIIEPTFPQVTNVLKDLLKRADRGPLKLSVDVETRGGHLACTGIAWSKLDAICIPHLRAVVAEMANWQSRIHYWREEEEAFILYLLCKLLRHSNVEVIGQNFLYDAQYFYRHFHFIPRFKRDTMIAQHSMFSSMRKGLDFLSSLYTEYHVYWKDESKDWDPKLGERQLWIYNCKDCCVTYEIDDSQQAAIDSMTATSWPKLREIHDFQQSLFWPVLEAMNTGLRVDNESKARLSAELSAAIDERNQWIREVIGQDLNIKSPVQMKDLFYRQFAQKPVISRKTGSPTTDDGALEKISSREPLLKPLCDKIRELRSLNVFRSTFLEAPVDHDLRMRCSFNITGTETYRFSSSENAFGSGMNLQNIPTGDESEGLPNIRKLFVVDEDHEYFDIDLDSADLRVVVWESDCKEMKQMFAEGLKPYVEVAKEYYRDPTITKHHPSYKLFKALCHGTNYLGTASGLSSRIGLLTSEVERIQKWYYGKFPEIKTWQEDLCKKLMANRYVENVFGYRIWFFSRIEGTVFNQAVAAIPQSTVACLINRGFHNIHTNETDIKVLLQVHDSLAGQFPSIMRDEAVRRIVQHCSVPLPYNEPLTIPVGIVTSASSWGGCK